MQYIDSAMVGSLGANASAAIGLVSTSTWLLGGITYAVSAGFSVQVAHNIGAGRDAEARSVVRHGLCTALCVAGILCALGLSIHSMLPTWLGGDPAIRYDASKYFMVYALMIPFSQINSLNSSYLQCSGDMLTPSILNAAMCLLDVVFNTIFIPHFGVWVGHRHGECVCGRQPDDDVALPVVQPAFAAQPQRRPKSTALTRKFSKKL